MLCFSTPMPGQPPTGSTGSCAARERDRVPEYSVLGSLTQAAHRNPPPLAFPRVGGLNVRDGTRSVGRSSRFVASLSALLSSCGEPLSTKWEYSIRAFSSSTRRWTSPGGCGRPRGRSNCVPKQHSCTSVGPLRVETGPRSTASRCAGTCCSSPSTKASIRQRVLVATLPGFFASALSSPTETSGLRMPTRLGGCRRGTRRLFSRIVVVRRQIVRRRRGLKPVETIIKSSGERQREQDLLDPVLSQAASRLVKEVIHLWLRSLPRAMSSHMPYLQIGEVCGAKA